MKTKQRPRYQWVLPAILLCGIVLTVIGFIAGQPDLEPTEAPVLDSQEPSGAQKTTDAPTPTSTEEPTDPYTLEDLIITQDPELYSYEDMVSDTAVLAGVYPEYFSYDSLGQTVDGRELLHFVIGDPEAETAYLISGGIHAREYITSQLVMKQTAQFLAHLSANASYHTYTYRELMQDKCIHVVAMINPDGISISQYGPEGIQTAAVREKIVEIAELDGEVITKDYLRCWKSNANGVDLNRNFDALWEDYGGPGHPSSDRYKGTAPGCEAESKALIDLTEKEQFHRTISYHAMGEVIYWYFGQEGDLLEESKAYAKQISATTGYWMDANYGALDPAGYKDWCLHKLGIVGITIEIGTDNTPVDPAQFQRIWEQNQYVWEETLLS